MMRPLYLITILLFPLSLLAQAPMGAKWGDTRRDVMNKVSKEPKYATGDMLTYESIRIAEYDLQLNYGFRDNKLVVANYGATAPIRDSAKINSAFHELIKQAIIDFGEYHTDSDDNSQLKKLVFQSADTKAVIFFGKIGNDQLSLSAHYMNQPTPPSKKLRVKKQ